MSGSGALDGELVVLARIPDASNETFYGTIDGVPVIYKPSAGEKTLWDFPDGDLAQREFASYLISECLGWNLVPPTRLRDGPYGPGMVQLWQNVDTAVGAVDVVPAETLPRQGWRLVLRSDDEEGQPVALVHEDSTVVRCMAVFDVIVNNADRKGGHVLAMPDGHRYGVDHGVTFHTDDKLRTVLWGWLGEELTPDEVRAVAEVRDRTRADLGRTLAPLVSVLEIRALERRCRHLLSRGVLPAPRGEWPAIPWPPF
jgi:uncharacterized repeat protein (TIGR03843 family)